MEKLKYIAAFGIFSIITTEFGIIGILPQIAAHYNISIDVAGWLLSSFALVIALFGPWITLLTSQYDRKKMMILALVLFVISNILSSIAPFFYLQLIARVLPAFLHPVYFTSAITVAIQSTSKENGPKAIAIVFAGISLATVIGVPLITYVAELFDWQASMIASGIFNLIACLGVWWFIPNTPVLEKVSHLKQLDILKKPTFLLALLTTCLLVSSMFASYGYFAEYMEKVNRLNGAQISLMLMLFGTLGVAGNWAAGKLLSKSVSGTVIASLCMLIVIFFMLSFLEGYSLSLVLLVCIWGFVHTACFLISQVYINCTRSGAGEFANSLGLSFGNLGLTIGTAISGWIIGTSGIIYTPWVSIALAISALSVVGVKTYIDKKAKYKMKIRLEEAC